MFFLLFLFGRGSGWVGEVAGGREKEGVDFFHFLCWQKKEKLKRNESKRFTVGRDTDQTKFWSL